MCTIRSGAIVIPDLCGNSEPKDSSTALAKFMPKQSPVRLDNRTADREAQSHSTSLRRDERLEQAPSHAFGYAGSAVGNRDLDGRVFRTRGRQDELLSF